MRYFFRDMALPVPRLVLLELISLPVSHSLVLGLHAHRCTPLVSVLLFQIISLTVMTGLEPAMQLRLVLNGT